MPLYDYRCQNCGEQVERNVKSDDRLLPESEPCKSCGEVQMKYIILSTPSVSYSNAGSLKTTDSFNDRLKEIKAKVPERFKSKLNDNIR
jgi:putative FmdB family regulatory protein